MLDTCLVTTYKLAIRVNEKNIVERVDERYFGPSSLPNPNLEQKSFPRQGRKAAGAALRYLLRFIPSLLLSACSRPSPSLLRRRRGHGGARLPIGSLPLRPGSPPRRLRFRLRLHLVLRGRDPVLRERYPWLPPLPFLSQLLVANGVAGLEMDSFRNFLPYSRITVSRLLCWFRTSDP